MAARSNKIRHDENTRRKIQASQLVNRLRDHALGRCDMSATQVRAALGLLDKALPSLQSIEADVHGDMVQRVVSAEPIGDDEWERRYADSLGTTAGSAESLN